ncbi:MAG: DUF4982 domain-containing protein, partial [Kiritimatiellaceae bacterium]|nr:DUF4982 domain-containing protein [Kiritimatiellaceae bacterium]
DDSSWKLVSAPHTYNDTDTFDNWSPSGHKGEMDQWGGKTWYRKHFVAPDSWQGKKVFIEFEAVRQLSEIYLNGEKIGMSENGFLPFGFDISSKLKIGESNVIAVMCDNSFLKDSSGAHWDSFQGGAKLPWNNPHWHPAHGGIYRNVFIHVKDPLHLTLPIYSNLETVGTYVYASEISRESAVLNIEAQVKNDRSSAVKAMVTTELIDNTGKVVTSMDAPIELSAGATTVAKLKAIVENPQLWEPGYPYLYTVRTTITTNGKSVDSNVCDFGFRWFRLDKTKGFYINDRYVKLQGWGQKSTDEWPGLGAAMPDWMHDYTLKLMLDAGGNFVRWGHTAGAPVHIRAADKYGIITLQPGVDGEKDVTGHPWKIRAAAFRDMIIYYRNHPSILMWEGGNQSVSREHVEELKAIVDTYDPHGARAYGHRRCNPLVAEYCDLTVSTEGSGYQKSLPTVEGEYNREESPRRVWDDFSPPDFDYKGAKGTYDLTSEQFAINQLFQYDKISRRAHCGGANWIFTDSTSGGRVQSEVCRTSGEIDGVRLPKEAYYVCKVLFTDQPDVHIIGHWSYPKDTVKPIYVAADCDEVELFVNGRSLGRQTSGDTDKKKRLHRNLFTFPDVKWEAGSIKAIGYVDGEPVADQEKKTAGEPVALKITELLGSQNLQATGSDVALFDVEAVDENGQRCPTYQQPVNFSVEGPVIWRGGYNSGKINSTNKKVLDLECGINRVAVRSTRQAGAYTIEATADGLKPASIELVSVPVTSENGLMTELPSVPPQDALTPLPLPSEANDAGEKNYRKPEIKPTEFFEDVSYSGPSETVRIIKTQTGAKLFTDHHQKLGSIPDFLKGGEFIQLPNADWDYSAVDLVQFNCTRDAVITIAHDERLEKMEWLTKSFTDTGKALKSGRFKWSLYSRTVKKGDSVLIGSNTETESTKRWMMIIFAAPIQDQPAPLL